MRSLPFGSFSKEMLKELIRRQRSIVYRSKAAAFVMTACPLVIGAFDRIVSHKSLILLVLCVLDALFLLCLAFEERADHRRLSDLEFAFDRFRPSVGFRDPTSVPRDDLDVMDGEFVGRDTLHERCWLVGQAAEAWMRVGEGFPLAVQMDGWRSFRREFCESLDQGKDLSTALSAATAAVADLVEEVRWEREHEHLSEHEYLAAKRERRLAKRQLPLRGID